MKEKWGYDFRTSFAQIFWKFLGDWCLVIVDWWLARLVISDWGWGLTTFPGGSFSTCKRTWSKNFIFELSNVHPCLPTTIYVPKFFVSCHSNLNPNNVFSMWLIYIIFMKDREEVWYFLTPTKKGKKGKKRV